MLAASSRGDGFALLFTQWERLLYELPQFTSLPPDQRPFVMGEKKGKPQRKLDPFGPIEPWREVGRLWARSPIVENLQRLYPDPPFVLFVSNNESDRLRWFQSAATSRMPKRARQSKESTRRAFGDGYLERYAALMEGFREALGPWKDRVRFVTWGGANAFMGRTNKRTNRSSWTLGGQPNFGLSVPGRLNIFPYVWDGASARYYITHARGEDDRSNFSPQASSMYFPLQLADACKVDPDFYWELSTWADPEYRAAEGASGRPYNAKRYAGLVEWGMWMARPQTVRPFNYGDRRVEAFADDLALLATKVDSIHSSPVLRRFWEESELVLNPTRAHPHQIDLPEDLRTSPPWYALEAVPGPTAAWSQTSAMPVWALARVRGMAPEREWLLYVQSPGKDRSRVEIDLPEFGDICVPALEQGARYLVSEEPRSVRALTSDGAVGDAVVACPAEPGNL